MENIIAAALVTVELKETIMSKFKAAMYSLIEDTFEKNKDDFVPVSYTHLTLPTIYSV